jgi:3-deoxy-7-phosphoheptulonate synthase
MDVNLQYKSNPSFTKIFNELSALQPLVSVAEIDQLNSLLKKVAHGEGFFIQGGDCAETFTNNHEAYINKQMEILLNVGTILKKSIKKPLIYIGRIAGQYAKPRSNFTETKESITLNNYFGDIINRFEFNDKARQFDPTLMLRAYKQAKFTLQILNKHNNKIFVSHEAFLLPYEQALTKSINGISYNLSTHFPWIGMRTLNLNSEHVQYMKHINNPIAIKIGHDLTPNQLIKLILLLNPLNKLGRLTLIHRLGAKNISNVLPTLIKTIQRHKFNVVWCCDPMHGNTHNLKNGIKTRNLNHIIDELTKAFEIHQNHNSTLGGIHLEFTAENVTECIGGRVKAMNLHSNYKSYVDPRLNKKQVIELACRINKKLWELK